MLRSGLTSAPVAALIAVSISAATVMPPAAAAPVKPPAAAGAASATTGSPFAGISGLGVKQKAAKKRAMKRCRTKRTKVRREHCRKRVIRNFKVKAKAPVKTVPAAPVATINVADDYFSPDVVSINSGDTIRWDWNDLNHDPHNITMLTGPEGVDRNEFQTSSSPAVQYSFSRRFTVPGTYTFRCSLHFKMTLTVKVS